MENVDLRRREMFESISEQQARKEILISIKEYADKFHGQKKTFQQDRIYHMPLAFMTVRRWLIWSTVHWISG